MKKSTKIALFSGSVVFAYLLGKQMGKANDIPGLRDENLRLKGQLQNEVKTSNGLLKTIKELSYHLGKSNKQNE